MPVEGKQPIRGSTSGWVCVSGQLGIAGSLAGKESTEILGGSDGLASVDDPEATQPSLFAQSAQTPRTAK